MTTPKIIHEFRGQWRFLSNFHPCLVMMHGIRYPTAEHAYQACKTNDLELRKWIAEARRPGEAKFRGSQIPLHENWERLDRYQAMSTVLYAKFMDNISLAIALLSTGDAKLVEGNRWHDQHWGSCDCGEERCLPPGENHLGHMLMNLRGIIRRSF